jgi:hypothetical protein
MDNLDRKTRSTRPKPLFFQDAIPKSELFETAMPLSPFFQRGIVEEEKYNDSP